MRFIVAVVVASSVASSGCGGHRSSVRLWPDAPMQLRDDSDRGEAIDQLWVLPIGAARDAVRLPIAKAIAARLTDAIEEERPHDAEALLFELAQLWQLDPAGVGRGLAEHVATLKALRAMFAKSGWFEPTIATLAILAEIEPAERTAHLAELDELLGFADDLESAENGPEAMRAQPIQLLQPAVLALPLPWLVDKYVALLRERQKVISERILAKGASIQLVRAHHDILATSQRIAVVLARAGRTQEIASQLSDPKLIGGSRELAVRAELIVNHPTADAYYDLAEQVRTDKDNGDENAALAICLAGLRKFPRDSSLLAAAAGDAASLGRIDQPIELYENSVRASNGQVDSALALRLGKLYADRIARLAFGGRPGAATREWHELEQLMRVAANHAPHPVWSLVAANGETALGRGLLSQGRLRDAERALVASLELAPSIDAYETLAQIHYKTDRLASAARYATAGIKLTGESKMEKVRRAKLARIAGDVARAAGASHDAASLYLDAMRTWASLGDDSELPRSIAAERKLEFARALWFVGESAKAVNLVFDAIDADPSAAANYASASAFLIAVGAYPEALDIVHRALTQSEVSELYKVYMCLWIQAEAHRRDVARDRQAHEYLASRQGDLWYELLAQAATERIDLPQLEQSANTAPRRAELAFYRVVLALDAEAKKPEVAKKLLTEVVDAHLIMDAEYDLARQYLAHLSQRP